MPQIARAGKDRLLAFHVCDWLVPTKDILNDRGMMGDGVIDIRSVRAAVEAQGFAGYSEIEIFSDDWWSRPMDEVLADLHRAASVGGLAPTRAVLTGLRSCCRVLKRGFPLWYRIGWLAQRAVGVPPTRGGQPS